MTNLYPKIDIKSLFNFSAKVTIETQTPSAQEIVISAHLKDGTPLPDASIALEHFKSGPDASINPR